MKQQEAFEAWATSQQINITRDGFGGYDSHWTDGALAGWKAAQAQTAFEDGSTPEYRKGFSDGLKEVDLPTMKDALDAGDGCLHSTIDNLRHEVGRQKTCILGLREQVQHLVADQVAMQDQLRVYQGQSAVEPAQHFPFVPWSKEAEMMESWAQPAAEPVAMKQILQIYIDDVNAGDWHRPQQNYVAGWKAGCKHGAWSNTPPAHTEAMRLALEALKGLIGRVGEHAYEPQYSTALAAILAFEKELTP